MLQNLFKKKPSKLIIDVGMHVGRDTEFYLKKGFNVVGIDANPHLTNKVIEEQQEFIQSGQLKVLNIGITNKEEEKTFYINSQKDDWSSFIKDWNKTMWKENTKLEEHKIKCFPLSTIINEHGVPYYLKIDVEGNDIECLKSLEGTPSLPEFISIELPSFNNLPNSDFVYTENLIYLYNLGYRKFQIIDQSKSKEVSAPKPAKEGNYVDFKFDGFSSGLFGKELPDNWQNIDKTLFDYLYYLNAYKFPGEYRGVMDRKGWFDVHAKF